MGFVDPAMAPLRNLGNALHTPNKIPYNVDVRMPWRPAATPPGQLPIANPAFVPDPTRVLQNLTNQVNAGLASDLSRAATVLSEAELHASAHSAGMARLQYGNALERLVVAEISADPDLLGQMYRPVGGPSNPDFVGVGIYDGMNFDITTPGQINVHLSRPGYGADLNIVTYDSPPGLMK
jgi:hypothetical protein